ncbi:MAG TPA: helix-turn-helix domain-containing protein, partial [Ignavibacteria bacterium]
VSGNFKVSRAAIYKHVKILRESGLVVVKQHGRERFCEVKPEKLKIVADWVEHYRKLWSARLDSLEQYLEKLQNKHKTKPKRIKHDRKK